MRRVFAATLASVVFVGAGACSHGVVIDSEPQGAEVKVNGEKIGVTPVTYNETSGWEKVYDLELSKAGYKPMKKHLKQQDWNTPMVVTLGVCGGAWVLGTLGAGIFVPLPLIFLLWSRQLPDRVALTMERGSSAPAETGTAQPPAGYGY